MSDDSPRLYLLSPPLSLTAGDVSAFAGLLEQALAGAEVACVLLDLSGLSEGDAAKTASRLVPIAQARGAAVLLNEARIVGRAKADGLHVRASGEALPAAVEDAVEAMKPDRIVGVGGVRSRHDSMTAGESDVDYILFGDPAPDGWSPPLEDILERVAWWAEIFNIPCVGYAASLADVEAIAAAGADFVALRDAVWTDERGPAAAVAEAAALAQAGAKARAQ